VIETIAGTTYSGAGPWLIGEKELTEIAKTLDDEWVNVEKRYEARVLEEARKLEEQRLSYERKEVSAERLAEIREDATKRAREQLKTTRKLTLYLSDETKTQAATLAEATRRPEVIDRKITAFDLQWESAGLSLRLGTRREWSFRESEIQLSVEPRDDEVARGVFTAIRTKLTDPAVAPARHVSWWLENGGPVAFIVLMVTVVISLVAVTAADNARRVIPPTAVVELLDGGIAPEERDRALELVLRKQYDLPTIETVPRYSPLEFPQHWLKWMWICSAVSFVLLIFHPPKFLVGIGEGRGSLTRWRWWIRIATVTLPTVAATQVGTLLWSILKPAFGL